MNQPPARDAFRLLDWIMSRHVHEYLDVAGRPIGEGRAAAFQHVQTDLRSCPYSGSRFHHPKMMNGSALRGITPAWGNILTMLSWLSRRHRHRTQADILTSDDLSRVTGAGVFLADFLVLRQNQPLGSREIPLEISGLYKVCLGFQLAYLPEKFSGDTVPTRLPNAAGFYAYLEENELLIGEHEVCSGSPALITQAYEAITICGEVDPEAPPLSCASLEIAWEQFDTFTHHAADLWRELVRYVIHAQDFFPQLADPRLPKDVQLRLNDCLKSRADQLLAGQVGLVTELARGVIAFGGRPASVWRPAQAATGAATPLIQPASLTATVLTWLGEAAGADAERHAPVIASALHAQLGPYDVYEATVLTTINGHMKGIREALGLGQPSGALTASALSHVCGRTLRDWGDSSW